MKTTYSYSTFCLPRLKLILGAALPPVKEKTEHFDSNCITPVSFSALIFSSLTLQDFKVSLIQYVIVFKGQLFHLNLFFMNSFMSPNCAHFMFTLCMLNFYSHV